jgi:hypothetical protein
VRAHAILRLQALSILLLVSLLLIAAMPVSAWAAPPREAERERAARPETEEFRHQITEFSDTMARAVQGYLEESATIVSDDPELEQHREMMRKARNAFVRAKHVLPAASENDIERLREAFAQMPQLLPASAERVTWMRPSATRAPSWQRLDIASYCNGGQYTETSGGALAYYGLDFGWVSDMISAFLDMFNVKHNTVDPHDGEIPTPDWTFYDAGLKGGAQCTEAQALLDLIYELIPDTIGDVSVGVSVGVEVSVGKDIPNPLKTAFAILSWANKQICIRMDLANALGNDCAMNASFTILDEEIDAMAAEIALLDDLIAAHDAKMTAEHAAITALINARADAIDEALRRQLEFLERFHDLTVQMAIEKNLLDDGNDVMSLFQLPAEGSDPGGVEETGIELVRQIVEEAILNSQAAGLPVYQAHHELAKGDAALDRGDYRGAFASYRKAYLSAVK